MDSPSASTMSDGQENVPPSGIPRPTPTKTRTGIPLPSALPKPAALAMTATIAGEKRKPPSSPARPPAKRSVSGGASSLKQSMRGASGFAPTARPNGPSAGTRSTTTRPVTRSAAPTRPASVIPPRSRLAASSRGPASTSSTSSADSFGRPTRAPVAATRGRSLAGPSRTGITRPATSMGNSRPDDRVESIEKRVEDMREMMEQENAKRAQKEAEQQHLIDNLLNAQHQEKESRRALTSASGELAEMRARHGAEVAELERQLRAKEDARYHLERELRDSNEALSRERESIRQLKQEAADEAKKNSTLNTQLVASQAQGTALQVEIERATIAVSAMKAELQAGLKQAADAEADAEERVLAVQAACDARIAEIEDELRAAESLRRKLHNQIQELKGNIRVFARVRPALAHELNSPQGLADIAFGDERLAAETGQDHLVVKSRTESATGKEREQTLQFQFDKIFQPKHGQREVFEEISMLAQSVLDGYNVCIFAYGQTGSGKSWTMEGAEGVNAGMIPRAIDMIFAVSTQLRDRGWKYHMEGTFLEVYNEVINDLLGSGQFDSKKHEIKIDKDKMTVTDTVSLPLSNPRQVQTLLERARSRRAVAATLMNERSSRSHSVFSLKVRGVNAETGEESQGILNLVDLAGSERLASSGADKDKDRLKETININKSLSALADVIGALGQGQQGGHVPYRNSMLTRLLQTSLSGSSKTLMLCNISPLAAHLGETVCSLRFATKVNTTPAGTARRTMSKA